MNGILASSIHCSEFITMRRLYSLSKIEIEVPDKSFDSTKVLYILVLALGILFRIGSYIQDRTLWYDEAMLASSIFQHDFKNLLEPLDYSQSAPVGFIFIVKILVTIFGSSQYILRLYSLVSGIAAIWVFYLLLKEIGFKRPLIGAAFFATVHPLLYYSTELKPYMQDTFFTLTTIYLYILYSKSKLSPIIYMLFCFLAVWISFPVIFIIGAVTGYNFFAGVINIIKNHLIRDFEKQRDAIKQLMGAAVFGVCALAGFGLCYLVYTGKATSNIDEMSMEYWRHLKFPLFPEDSSDWDLISLMVNNFLKFVFPGDFPTIAGGVLWIGGLLLLIKRRQDLFFYSFLTVLLTLIASSIGQYPMQDRLLLFLVPFELIAIVCFVEVLTDLLKYKALEVIVFIGIAALNLVVLEYSDVNNIMRERQEASNLINYLQNNIEDDEQLYVFPNAVPIYEYMTGYKHGYKHFPESVAEYGNLIFGTKYWDLECEPYIYKTTIDQERLDNNVQAIIKYPKVFILFYHQGGDAEYSLISTLKQYGTVMLFMDEKNTPLYLFTRYIYL